MYLNVIGVGRNGERLAPSRPKKREVGIQDLGAQPVSIRDINPTDTSLFLGFLRMADEGAAHLTVPHDHQVQETHVAITRICEYVKKYLYDSTNRRCLDIEAHLASAAKDG